jgi:RNA polymerase sigma-70 factor, ECF subfamily
MMTEPDVSAYRSRLFGLAYRMLGSPMDADDVVQEAFVRWQTVDRTVIGNAEAWLVTVTTHVALDRLRALQTERHRYAGPWIPEPIVRDVSADPAHHSEMIDDVSVVVLRMLERLTPEERAAFVLYDVFSYRHSEIAAMLGRPEAAIRQLVHRARQRLRTDKPRFTVDRKTASALADRFMRAFEAGDKYELRTPLTQNVTHVSDGGGVVVAARKPVVGRERVLRLWLGLRAKHWKAYNFRRVQVGGDPGFLLSSTAGVMRAVIAVATDDTGIVSLHVILAPDKVARAVGWGRPAEGRRLLTALRPEAPARSWEVTVQQ